ncbi:hypothetical protein OPV22_010786 [Ensete ventricosum]|uniref:Uncharacterized protein n=1 Tax=Ensete ventricosum TaxID=4639 RepID=A0A426Y0W8_ENSVE|nr:hypothetical protein OPV22_010786 [Ensete ventricosum]RRT45437.1 hypothetical protein B296_00028559 [Ensete ventricosum]RWW72136.1 hypothetical protein BHE74_00020067 [Ensete ventricosum]RZS12408.1 hypothetical protein BHM03_00043845 [Ensete ventricosum]
MAKQYNVRPLQSFHGLGAESPYPSSTSFKIRSLLKAYLLRHISHAKSMFMELLKKKKKAIDSKRDFKLRKTKKHDKTKKKLFSFFNLQRSWSSSCVTPMPLQLPISEFDDSTVILTEDTVGEAESPLGGCLDWLEDESEASGGDTGEASEIDRLAERFIARCHEKFRLEKQESYRWYQEMLARSI